MKKSKCTIYDCEFDNYVEGIIIGNKVFAISDSNNPIPAKCKICEYVDYGMVQFYVGEYDCYLNEDGDAKWGFFNFSDGEIIVPPIYDQADCFSGNRARVILEDKHGFLDQYGKVAIDLIWDDSYGSFYEGLCAVKKHLLWGYINKEGRVVIEPRYEFAEQFKLIKNDVFLARVKENGKYGYIDKNGKFVIKPHFDMVEQFLLIKKEVSVALVENDGKYGYIDNDDNYIFEPSFDNAKSFWGGGFAPVMTNGLWGFIDIHGDLAVKFQFEQVGNVFFNDRFYTVQKNNHWGIMDDNLNIIMMENDARFLMYEDKKIYMKNGRITCERKFNKNI